jgi:hypothetical protein
MYWLLAFVFWFSLLFGTHVTGNGVGNWIALAALVLFIRSRRRARRADPEAEPQDDSPRRTNTAPRSGSRPDQAHEPASATDTRRSRQRWR